jgi:TolB-like protein/DNA-binding winged helix-turn-helix (wHTH) protein/tetratricopeptide (TPR) repeat protein
MDAPINSGRRITTGLFEVDLTSGEVLREGRRVPLQDQPFRVLALLLEDPGQIVTREQMQATLWPADTYVGFDEGLNTAIRKLRVLFGDSADNPRFIETIPRRGYRFIAPVNKLPNRNGSRSLSTGKPDLKNTEATTPGVEPELQARDGPARTVSSAASSRTSRRIWIWTLSIALAAILVFMLARVIARTHGSSPSATLPARREMLAVLPFQNLSDDPAQEYFSDGLTEETITDLGQLSPAQLGVIARTSAMVYKHSDKTVSEIGRELGVDYILEGSVRRENGRARISAQLIRVNDQTHLWAQSYDDQGLRNFLDVQNEIGRAIAEQVQVNIAPQRQFEMSKIHSVNPEAMDLYLKGRFYWNQRTPAAIRESIRFFNAATAADPGFALAYAGLADAYNISNIVGLYSPKESLPEARGAATRAILLNPSLAEAHAALGMEKSHYEFDLPGAKAEFQKAIELNPNSAYSHLFYSNCYLMPMSRRAEAIAENRKALELDPFSMPINNFLGETYLLAGDYSQSYQQFQHTIELDPNFGISHLYLASLLEITGKFEDAINENEKGQLLIGFTQQEASERAARVLRALRNGGEKGYWKERLAQDLHEMEKAGVRLEPSMIAEDYALAGEKDKAFEWLERAYEAREGGELTLLAVDPVWKNLHGDPRFSDLLRRIGLPE